jgi:hypothetical protein
MRRNVTSDSASDTHLFIEPTSSYKLNVGNRQSKMLATDNPKVGENQSAALLLPSSHLHRSELS